MITFIHRILQRFSTKSDPKQNAGPHDESLVETDTPEVRPFGMMISDAEDFISRKSYKNALDLYRMLDSQLSGSGDLMKINYVRERIESLIRIIMENPTPETMDIIEEEAKTAEDRYKSTVLEAEQYFSHDLYKEALYLYQKIEKEWSRSADNEKKNLHP